MKCILLIKVTARWFLKKKTFLLIKDPIYEEFLISIRKVKSGVLLTISSIYNIALLERVGSQSKIS